MKVGDGGCHCGDMRMQKGQTWAEYMLRGRELALEGYGGG